MDIELSSAMIKVCVCLRKQFVINKSANITKNKVISINHLKVQDA